jgi:putative flippase GtrA
MRVDRSEVDQFVRFAMVGVGNLVFDLLIFNALWSLLGHRSGLYMGVANGTAYAVATAAGYLANRFWSFRREGTVIRYLAVYACTGLLAAVGLPVVAGLAAGTIGTGVLVTNAVKIAYTAALAAMNYVGLRLFVFGARAAAAEAGQVVPAPTAPGKVQPRSVLDAS